MSVSPGLTLRTIAVLSGAVALSQGLVFAAPSLQIAVTSPPQLGVTGGPDLEGAPVGTDDDVTEIASPKQLVDSSETENTQPSENSEPAETVTNEPAMSETPELGCLSRTICAIKDKIRWQTPAWTASQCNKVASAILSSSKRYDISPSLLMAVMINESDMNDKAARITMRENKVYAKDSGLMAIRCVLGKKDKCLNGNVRGLFWTNVMNPATNIELGAKELAYWKNGGAVTRTIVKIRDASGHVRPAFKTVHCRHKDHGYWAHYNHGPRYIDHGPARHYPHRVAVIDHALASVLNVDTPELRGAPVTMHDPGKRQRTADRPLEARYRKLCSQIQSVGTCSTVAMNN